MHSNRLVNPSMAPFSPTHTHYVLRLTHTHRHTHTYTQVPGCPGDQSFYILKSPGRWYKLTSACQDSAILLENNKQQVSKTALTFFTDLHNMCMCFFFISKPYVK